MTRGSRHILRFLFSWLGEHIRLILAVVVRPEESTADLKTAVMAGDVAEPRPEFHHRATITTNPKSNTDSFAGQQNHTH